MEEHALGFDTLQLHAGQVLDSDRGAYAALPFREERQDGVM